MRWTAQKHRITRSELCHSHASCVFCSLGCPQCDAYEIDLRIHVLTIATSAECSAVISWHISGRAPANRKLVYHRSDFVHSSQRRNRQNTIVARRAYLPKKDLQPSRQPLPQHSRSYRATVRLNSQTLPNPQAYNPNHQHAHPRVRVLPTEEAHRPTHLRWRRHGKRRGRRQRPRRNHP